MSALAELMLSVFRGREDRIAYSPDGSAFHPTEPLSAPISPEKFESSHLAQQTCLGLYVMRVDNTVLTTALDFDDHDGTNPNALKDAQCACGFLDKQGFTPLLEISQSGSGAHVWLFFDKPVHAAMVRAFWSGVLERAELPKATECYPRQSRLKPEGLGNLIRFPLFNQSRFVDWRDPAHTIPPDAALSYITYATEAQIRTMCEWWDIPVTAGEDGASLITGINDDSIGLPMPASVSQILIAAPTSLLARRWTLNTTGMFDASYSSIAMSITVELVRAYIPTPEIEAALRYWCKLHDYAKGDRPDWIETTVRNAYRLAARRHEKKSLTGNTFAGLAHEYADVVYRDEEILIPTGIAGIDESIGGFVPGEVVVVSARPSHGKTALAMFIGDSMAGQQYPILLISLEMSGRENSRRVLLNIGRMATDEWKTEEGNKTLHSNIDEHYGKRAPMYFVEGATTIDRIEEVISQYVEEYGVLAVYLDYQGLASAGERNEYADQTEIAKRLKLAARRHDIVVVTLVQMNRESEKEGDGVPSYRHLRSSGEIEQSADVILFARWPWKDNPEKYSDKNFYCVYAAKCRNRGIKQQVIPIRFDPETQQFR